jgi:hypothetical protein
MKISGGFVTNTIENKLPNAFYSYVYKTCSCRPVRYFGTLFWDDITIFWDEHLLLLRFGPIRSLFNYHHNKLSSQTIVISSKNKVMQQTVPDHNLSQFSNCRSMWYLNLPKFSNWLELRQVLVNGSANAEIVGKFWNMDESRPQYLEIVMEPPLTTGDFTPLAFLSSNGSNFLRNQKKWEYKSLNKDTSLCQYNSKLEWDRKPHWSLIAL